MSTALVSFINRNLGEQPNSIDIIGLVENHLLEVNRGTEFNTSWAEGFISALANVGIIDEDEFEEILGFIKIYKLDIADR